MVINTKIGVKIILKSKKDIETMRNILGKNIYAEFFISVDKSKLSYCSRFIDYNKMSEDKKELIKRIFNDYITLVDCSLTKIKYKKGVCLSLSRDKNIVRGIIF